MTQGESIRASNIVLFWVHSEIREKNPEKKVTFQILLSLCLQTKGVIESSVLTRLQVPKKKVVCSSSIPTKGSDQSSKQLIIHGQKTTMLNPIKAALLQGVGNLTPLPIAACNKAWKIMKQLPDT